MPGSKNKKERLYLIKISRKGVDVKVIYTDELGKQHVATAFCKNKELAQDLADEVSEAIKQGYGFAKCRAILEGDSLPQHGGKREGSGRPPVEEPRKPYCFRLNEKEHALVKDFITRIKKENAEE